MTASPTGGTEWVLQTEASMAYRFTDPARARLAAGDLTMVVLAGAIVAAPHGLAGST